MRDFNFAALGLEVCNLPRWMMMSIKLMMMNIKLFLYIPGGVPSNVSSSTGSLMHSPFLSNNWSTFTLFNVKF